MANVFLFLFIRLVSYPVFAQSVFINEIAWMGTPVEGVEQNQWWRYEWLELYNSLDVPVGLDGWAIELSRDKPEFKISLKRSIDPKGYFLIGASDKIPNIDLNYKNLAGKFANPGQKVVLKNALGEVVDEVDARSGWPTGDNESKATMERDSNFLGWHTSADPGGTPKAQNSEATKFQQKTEQLSSSVPHGTSPLFIAFPGALLASALALAARRFLYLLESEPRSRRPEQRRRVG